MVYFDSLVWRRVAGGPFPKLVLRCVAPLLLLASSASWAEESVLVQWPLEGRLSSDYGPRGGRQHRGIDVSASTGTPVMPIANGRVVWAGARGNYGLLVELEHGEGWTSRYAHLDVVEVAVGELVDVDHRLGRVGSTGNATGPHLHLEVRHEGVDVDPFEVLP